MIGFPGNTTLLQDFNSNFPRNLKTARPDLPLTTKTGVSGRVEGDIGRHLIDEIENNLDGYDHGDAIATTRLLENLAAYIALLRRHIYEEDNIFFQMVARELSDDEEKNLLMQFKQEEERVGSKDVFRSSRKLVVEMQALINN